MFICKQNETRHFRESSFDVETGRLIKRISDELIWILFENILPVMHLLYRVDDFFSIASVASLQHGNKIINMWFFTSLNTWHLIFRGCLDRLNLLWDFVFDHDDYQSTTYFVGSINRVVTSVAENYLP